MGILNITAEAFKSTFDDRITQIALVVTAEHKYRGQKSLFEKPSYNEQFFARLHQVFQQIECVPTSEMLKKLLSDDSEFANRDICVVKSHPKALDYNLCFDITFAPARTSATRFAGSNQYHFHDPLTVLIKIQTDIWEF